MAVLALVMMSGCFFDSDDPLPPLEGDIYQYVVSDLKIPTNNNEAREFGLDLNGDKNKTGDNQLGMVLGLLENLGLGTASTVREALQRGGLLMLVEVQTTSLEDSRDAGLTTFLGGDAMPDACTDETNLATCGQHLKGTGSFSVDLDTASHQARGPIVGGAFLGDTGIMPVEFAISLAGVIRLDLRGARVKITELTPDGARGVFAGAIAPIDLEGVVIPEAAEQVDRIVVDECKGPTSAANPCGCSGRGKTLWEVFDKNHDCRVDVGEVASNDIVRSLFAPDVRVHGQDMLSFGVGVELARATF
ncbi:MAG: hypothetical protein ACKV2T_09295 [Kofleriaceae bacterium]